MPKGWSWRARGSGSSEEEEEGWRRAEYPAAKDVQAALRLLGSKIRRDVRSWMASPLARTLIIGWEV